MWEGLLVTARQGVGLVTQAVPTDITVTLLSLGDYESSDSPLSSLYDF